MTHEPRIRAATAADAAAIAAIVDQAYRHYIARIGKPPGPMLDDYAARVSECAVWVIEEGAVIVAIIVLLPAPDYLLLDNIAVSPAHQDVGLGRRLLAFAEARPDAPNRTLSRPIFRVVARLTSTITRDPARCGGNVPALTPGGSVMRISSKSMPGNTGERLRRSMPAGL